MQKGNTKYLHLKNLDLFIWHGVLQDYIITYIDNKHRYFSLFQLNYHLFSLFNKNKFAYIKKQLIMSNVKSTKNIITCIQF